MRRGVGWGEVRWSGVRCGEVGWGGMGCGVVGGGGACVHTTHTHLFSQFLHELTLCLLLFLQTTGCGT